MSTEQTLTVSALGLWGNGTRSYSKDLEETFKSLCLPEDWKVNKEITVSLKNILTFQGVNGFVRGPLTELADVFFPNSQEEKEYVDKAMVLFTCRLLGPVLPFYKKKNEDHEKKSRCIVETYKQVALGQITRGELSGILGSIDENVEPKWNTWDYGYKDWSRATDQTREMLEGYEKWTDCKIEEYENLSSPRDAFFEDFFSHKEECKKIEEQLKEDEAFLDMLTAIKNLRFGKPMGGMYYASRAISAFVHFFGPDSIGLVVSELEKLCTFSGEYEEIRNNCEGHIHA